MFGMRDGRVIGICSEENGGNYSQLEEWGHFTTGYIGHLRGLNKC